MKKEKNKGGRPRTIETLALINGQKGTVFLTEHSANIIFTMAGKLGIKINTQRMICFPTGGTGTAQYITKVTIIEKPPKTT